MFFMLWAFAGSGHRQAHGTNDVPWLPACVTIFEPVGHSTIATDAYHNAATNKHYRQSNNFGRRGNV